MSIQTRILVADQLELVATGLSQLFRSSELSVVGYA